MDLESLVCQHIRTLLQEIYDHQSDGDITLEPTSSKFEGTYTFVTFQLTKALRRKPEEIGHALGERLVADFAEITAYNVVKGFLNLSVSDQVWIQVLSDIKGTRNYGQAAPKDEKIMVEFSSPNTNKPLHLGHLRNNFLGYALSNIMEANGVQTIKANLVNDRGIHICKSMVAYQYFGNGDTPTTDRKGDKLVGDYYVQFDKAYKKQQAAVLEALKDGFKIIKDIPNLQDHQEQIYTKVKEKKALSDMEKEIMKTIKKLIPIAEKKVPIMIEAQDSLRKWEAGDEATVALWKKMNSWVYAGHNDTYKRMGVSFDQFYYESDTYLLGKEIVDEGLEKGVFYRKEDQSVWIDLSAEGLDHKLVLRGDGTSVYITQDMGTADLKYQNHGMKRSVYVVGNEQDYHFKVLKLIMQRLGRPYAEGIYHMSYGMVDLPSGKMKSREGTVVDADDLMEEMENTAKERTLAQGKIDGFTDQEANTLYRQLGLGALKYYLLRVDPKKRILFDPAESVDFQGDTGVFIQYNHARICSIIRRAESEGIDYSAAVWTNKSTLETAERELIKALALYPKKIEEAAREYSPSVIAQYVLFLARAYSKFFAECSIFGADHPETIGFRVALSEQSARVIKKALALLGMEAPEKM